MHRNQSSSPHHTHSFPIHARYPPLSPTINPHNIPKMGFLNAEDVIFRSWVLITGMAGFGAAIGAYRKPHSPHKTLYNKTTRTDNESFAHMYGTWLLTSTMIRVTFFLSPLRNPQQPIFWLVFGTYIIAAFHFITEIFVYKSVSLLPGGFAPLIVAGLSIAWCFLIVLSN